tara:strand:+ start:777 stop:911 length:135 start_codon:yes stop_codon:yes gene_type:complete
VGSSSAGLGVSRLRLVFDELNEAASRDGFLARTQHGIKLVAGLS